MPLAVVCIGHEVAFHARRLGALALTVEIPTWDGWPVLFSAEHGRVWATGRGFELELSVLPRWQRERPPGM